MAPRAPRARGAPPPHLRSLERFPFGTLLVHLAIAFAGAYGLYLVIVHALILTPLLPSLIATEDLKVEWSRAWSLWPGRVQIRGLQIRARDGSAEYFVAAPRAVAGFDLVSLFRKTVDVRWVDAQDVTFRARARLAPGEASPERTRGFPRIPGFADPPTKAKGPGAPASPDALWRLRVRAADCGTREVWIGAFRWSGDAEIHGGFWFHPATAIEVDPTTVIVRSGGLALEQRPFASETRGELSGRVHRFELDASQPILSRLDARSTLASTLEDLSFLRRWLRGTAISSSGGEGRVSSDVRIERGVVMPGSEVAIDAKDAMFVHPEATATTDVHARIEADEDALRITADLVDARVQRKWAEVWPIAIRHASVVGRSPSRAIAELAERLVMTVRVPEASLHDVAVLRTILPDDSPVELGHGSGVLRGRGTMTVHRGVVQGRLELETTERVPFAIADVPMSGTISAGVELAAFEIGPMRGRVPSAWVELDDVVVRGDERAQPWWGRIRLVEGRASGAAGLRVEGTLLAHVKDARPILHVLHVKDVLPTWTRGLLVLDGLDAKAKLRWTKEGVSIRDFDAEAGLYDLRGRLSTRGHALDGEIGITYGLFGVKVVTKDGASTVSPLVE